MAIAQTLINYLQEKGIKFDLVEHAHTSTSMATARAANLPAHQIAKAVVLCDVVGLTYEEIADATDVPVGTVRSRIHRGRSMLRGMLTWPV